MLHWVDKFKELLNKSVTNDGVIMAYLLFCDDEEAKLKERIKNGNA